MVWGGSWEVWGEAGKFGGGGAGKFGGGELGSLGGKLGSLGGKLPLAPPPHWIEPWEG